ncbi:nicotinamide-nucleotide amidase [Ruegeria halocynthiae]|uniref:Nicotinamide-nucleotide amidase n=1 Tax=Ruegeria halocynthiae TaxID=985054 RepID=A0A1H2SVJ2_9RHOB|nr:CinA family protein [Ruegeria halocynthiae]SDW35039.1 nicotinamide-nucleotide amidase [Ruegeria halocynthiae]
MNVADLLDRAKARGVRIATAESCTGGMVAAALTDIPGSSAVVERGFITYTNTSKQEMLGVRAETLDAVGAVSEQVAREMAEGALRHSHAQLAVSITGIAGPGGSEFKPEGRVCFGVAAEGHQSTTETVEFGALGRNTVRQQARDRALALLLHGLSNFA